MVTSPVQKVRVGKSQRPAIASWHGNNSCLSWVALTVWRSDDGLKMIARGAAEFYEAVQPLSGAAVSCPTPATLNRLARYPETETRRQRRM